MLVEGLIPEGGLVGIYGTPGCGKSFFAKDVCRAIETGALWRGKLVRQGLVVYIAAEGGTGFGFACGPIANRTPTSTMARSG